MGEDSRRPPKGPGRPPNPVTGPEPGKSYITELVRWERDVAAITRTELAKRVELSLSVVSEFLGKVEEGWRPNDEHLEKALRIIKACGGGAGDLDAWREYHFQLAKYQASAKSDPGLRPPAPPAAGGNRPGPSGAAGPADEGSLDHLRRLSRAALADATLVIAPGPLHPGGVGLDRLYVPRGIESVLFARLSEPSAHIVVGEPGYGKTSLLWSLHRKLADSVWQPFFIKATVLSAGLTADADDDSAQMLTLDTLDAALRTCRAQHISPVLLVDTLDLLMHSPRTRDLVSELLGLAHRHGVRLVVTSRPGEAELLAPSEEEAAELRMIRLGRYNHDERAAAVTRYAKAFYRFGNGIMAASDYREVQQRVMNAVYHDLPLREVCDNPLTLRLLFELYAPEMPDDQVDVASLYDQFWNMRVRRDARAGQGDEGGRLAAAGSPQPDVDLRDIARTLARVMLARGVPELSFKEAVREVARLSDEPDQEDVERLLLLLAGRDAAVISPTRATVRFPHQTFFEYAAAKFVSASRLAEQLIDKVCADPGDLLLAAVAAQALPRLRTRSEADRLLVRLIEAEEQNAVTLGLSVYAHLPMSETNALGQARHALATASADSVRRFLLLLPGIRHENADRWVQDLRIVWERSGEADEDLRVHLLEALARLAGRSPVDAAEFLDEHGCMDWLRSKEIRFIRGHSSLYLRVLAPVYVADPQWVRGEVTKFWDLFVEGRAAQGAADILEMMRERIALMPDAAQLRELNTVLSTFGGRVQSLAEGVGPDVAAAVIHAYGRIWAELQLRTGVDDIAGLLDAEIDQLPEPDVHARARLYGLGHLARSCTAEQAGAVLATVGEARAPGWQTAMLDAILMPLIAEGDGTETAATRQAAAMCRAALGDLPAPERNADGSRTRPALYREAVCRARRSGGRLLDLLPEQEGGEWQVWLRPDGLMKLVAPAAAAGHPQATEALRAWCTDKAWRETQPRETASVIHAAIMTPCHQEAARQPHMVRYLVDDALLTRNPVALVTGLDRAGEPSAPFVEEHREPLARLLAELVESRSGETRRLGYRLWRALVAHARWTPPDPVDLCSALAGRPGTRSLHIAVLELCLAAVESDQWSAAQAAVLVPALCATEDAGRAARAAAGSRSKAKPSETGVIDAGDDARHVRVAMVCRTGALDTADQRRATIETASDLALNGGYDLDDEQEVGRFTKAVRQLGRLAERLLDVEPEAAAALLLSVGAELHTIDPGVSRPQREIANRWRTPVAQMLARLGPVGRKRFMLDVVESDVSLARVAIEIFAQQYVPLPAWFRELAQERQLHPKLKEALRGNLFFHNRSHGGEPWRALLG